MDLSLFHAMPALHKPDNLQCDREPRCQQATRRTLNLRNSFHHTPSSPILRNQTLSTYCAIGFLYFRPVLLISLVFPSLPISILFMMCAAKWGSQPRSGLSSAMRTLVFCSAQIRRVLHCCFTSLTAISARPLAM